MHASSVAASDPSLRTLPRFPGIPSIVDGSEAIGSVETRIAEAACAYPITPSTTMAAVFQSAVANGQRNLWGTPLAFQEPESEHSSASAAEGFAVAGGRVTNFTAGQGLILMKEVLYVIAGKRLPAVFHVGARALTSQALNIHAGHDDIYGVADTGWGIVVARNAQEAADLTAIARRTAEATETPFLVCQDGFLTTHTMENVWLPEDELLREFVGDPRDHLRDLFDPAQALMTGVVQNQDSYMKGRIAQRGFTDRVAPILAHDMALWGELTGRPYGLVAPYRCDDAEAILVAMGTMADTAISVVDHLRSQGRRVGVLNVTSFRPFPATEIASALAGAAAVAVVERADEPLAADNPLTRETKAALYDHAGAHGLAGPGRPDRGRRAGLARHRRRRPDRHLRPPGRPGRRPRPAPRGGRHPSPAGADRAGRRPAARGRVLDARPLHRRLRLGDHQQGRGDRGRRALRALRPGLPALRVGEEGPADDLLPDRRRVARSASMPSCRRSTSCRCTGSTPSSRATRCAGWPTRPTSSCRPRCLTPSRSGPRCRPPRAPR